MDLTERRQTTTRRHPWEVARSEFFFDVLRRFDLLETTERWLDVGAGDAWFAGQLRDRVNDEPSGGWGREMVCWDINYDHSDLERSEDIGGAGPALRFTAEQPLGRFDGLFMLDVIEHVEDDLGFVNDVIDRSLDADGWVLVSVPAYQRLFTEHDAALLHFRRYSPAQCQQLLALANLEIVAEGGLFHSLLAPRALQAISERVRTRPRSDGKGIGAWAGGPLTTRALTVALRAEGRASLALGSRSRVLPGLSYWALCTRPGSGRLAP